MDTAIKTWYKSAIQYLI